MSWLTGLMLCLVTGLAHAQTLVAVDDSFGIPFGQPLQVEPLGVLENDTLGGEPAGENGATAELVSSVANGTLTCPTDVTLELCADGSFDYTPGPGFSGTDSFTYQAVFDIATVSTPTTVTLTACTGGPDVFSCWKESSYLSKLTEYGYGTFLEGFEGTAWDTVRSTFNTTNSAPEIISQGIIWTSNHSGTNNITIGAGPAFNGLWGAYDPNHGFATGSSAECNVDIPPDSCLYHDGLSGNILQGGDTLNGVGGYITGTTGANIAIIINGTIQTDIGRLPDPGHHFFGVIDVRAAGFTRFEFRELDGKVGQARYIFGDDFIIATSGMVAVNNPPVLDTIGNQTVNEGELLSILLTASDLDGDSWSFSMGDAPTGSSLVDNGDGTASFNWTPDFGQAGNYPVIFSVTDTGFPAASDSEAITITVGNVNRPPLLTPIGNQAVNEGELLSILLTASDPDGDSWSFSMSGAPTGSSLVDNGDGTASFSWTPDFGQSGNYPVNFTVTDNGLPATSDSEAITITVGNVNRPPLLTPIGNQAVNEGELLSILLTASDPDGDSWSFAVANQPLGSSLLDNGDGTASFSWTPDFDQTGNYPVSFTVTDNGLPAASDSEAITITVGNVNRPPLLSPIGAQTVNEGELLSILLTASDPDGDSWSFAVANPPLGSSLVDNGDGTASFSWTPDFDQTGNYPVSFTVTDNGQPAASDSEAITITVGNVNRPPLLSPIGNQVVNEGELLSILLTASDPDGNNLSFAVSNPPLGSSFIDNGDGTASFSWTPDFDQTGNYPVSFTVMDNGQPAASDSEAITITVGNVNRPPLLSPIGNQVVNEGELLSILLTASDPDGNNLSFAVSNPPLGSSFIDNGDGTASFSWTPDFDQTGNYPVSFTVTDNGQPAASDSDAITITVGDVNRPPLLSPIGNQAVNEGELLSILLTASDPDGNNLSFAVSNPPLGSSFIDNGDGTASFSWTPDFGQTGNYPMSFIVVDDGLPASSDSEAITITVGDVNRPPLLTPIGNRLVNEGELLSILLTASDPDGNNLSFAVSNPPLGSSFIDNGDGTASFSWTPDFDQTGNYPVSFTVTDNGQPAASDSEAITITVGDVNRPPLLTPIGNRLVNEGELLSILLTASDPDGNNLSFAVSNPPLGSSFIDNGDGTASFSWTPDFGQAGNYPLSFTVTDNGLPATSDSEAITITVGAVNLPPLLSPIGNQAVNEGELLSILLTASDLDGDNLSFTVSNPPLGSSFVDNGDGTASFSWMPDFGQAGNYPLSFTVTDNGLPVASDSEAITITVGDVNRSPLLSPIGNQAVNEGELLSILLTASDPDGDSWSFSMSGAPTGSSLVDNGDGTASFNWTPDFGQAGNYPVNFTVTDTGLPAASDSEAITITVGNVNHPPLLSPIGAQTVNEGELLSILLTASDPDGDSWSFSMSGAPTGSSLIDNGDGTATFSWTPDFGQAGNFPVNFTVTDTGLPASSDSEAITITVGDVNRPPLLSPIGNQAVNEGELLSILLTASDPDGDSWSFSMSGAPTGSSLVDNGDGTASFNWTPDFGQAGNYPVNFTVTDTGLPAASDSEAITITVGNVNHPPLLSPIGAQTVNEGELLSILLTASDPDGDSWSFSMSGAPTGSSLIDNGDGTATFSWTPDFGQAGNFPLSFTVTDTGLPASSDSEAITITVGDVNRPPLLSPIGNQAVNEGELLSILLTASDPDGDSWSFSMSGAPTGSSLIDNGDGTAIFSWTPDFGQAGNYPVNFTVTDNGLPAVSDSEAITITVGDVNRPPLLSPVGAQTVNEGELLSILLTASDPDGDILSFAVANPPLGSSFVDNGDGTASFSWTPDFGQAGNYPVSFIVADDGLPAASDSEAITITVGDVNRPPLLSPIGNQVVNEGELLSILLTAGDPDGDNLNFAVSNPPLNSSFVDNGDGTANFSWSPDFGQAGNYPVSFTVTDDGLPTASDSEAITITVGDVNRPPLLSPIGNQVVNEGELLSILLTASDPDGNNLSFAVSNPPLGSSFIDNGDGTANFSWSPDFGQAGNYPVNFTVTDNGLPVAIDSEAITITVGNVNRPPLLSPIGNQVVNEGELLSILLTASDPDGNNLSFVVSNPPLGSSFIDNGDGTASFSWTPDFDQTGNYPVSFTVTDNGQPAASDSEAITITVGNVNRPPLLSPIGNQVVNEGELLSILLTASDPDGNDLSFAVSNPPLGSSFIDNGDGTASFSWTPDFGQAGNYPLRFTVTDNGLPATSDSEAITITVGAVNLPPLLSPIISFILF